jgi:hypothetical protein
MISYNKHFYYSTGDIAIYDVYIARYCISFSVYNVAGSGLDMAESGG